MSSIPSYVVRASRIDGKGVFAARNIEAGEEVCIMRGAPHTFQEFEQMHESGDARISCDQLQIGVRTYIVLEEPYIFFNHSCEPNVGIRGERTMTALRKIAIGEELVYDYSATEWTVQDYPPYYVDGWPMRCHCGAGTCRKKIGCFAYLPRPVKEAYLRSGVIQDHILARLAEPAEAQRCFVCEKYLLGPDREKTLSSARAEA